MSAGAHNPIGFLKAYFGLIEPNYSSSVSSLPSNETQYLRGNSQFSVIGYGRNSTGAKIVGAALYLPNATLASGIYINLTAKFHNNVSVKLSTGNIGGNPYTFVNVTYRGNVTEGIFSHDGNYFLAFVYKGAAAVSEKGLVNIMTEEIQALGNGKTLSYPSSLVSSSQAGTALGVGIDSSVYFDANITNMSSVMHSLSGISGNSSFGSGYGPVSSQYLANVTGVGVTVFENASHHEIAVSSFVTFRNSTYPSSLFKLLNLRLGGDKNFSPTYHAGMLNSKQYFFVSGNLSANSSVKISLLVCDDGNSLIVQAVLSPVALTYVQMASLASAQISDL